MTVATSDTAQAQLCVPAARVRLMEELEQSVNVERARQLYQHSLGFSLLAGTFPTTASRPRSA